MGHGQDRRIWFGGGAVVAVLIFAAAWFLLISPKMADTASLHDQTDAAQAQNTVLAGKVKALKTQNDNIDGLRTDLSDALAALPVGSGLSDFSRQLSAQANSSKVLLTSVTIGSAAPNTATGGRGVYAIPVTLVTSGSAANQRAFLNALQADGPRLALISNAQFSVGSGSQTASLDGSATLTTTLTLFATPRSAAEQKLLESLLKPSSTTP